MSIVRARLQFERDFTQVPNAWLRDGRLSHRARGILAEIMSHAEGWVVTIEALVQNGKEGREAVRAAVAELVEAKYLKLERMHSEGRLRGSTYVLNDPQGDGFLVAQKPAVEGPVSGAPEKRAPRNPSTKNTSSLEDQETSSSGAASDPRPEVIELCNYLADAIERNGSRRPVIGKRWFDACRLMLDTDKREPEKVRRAIDWSQADPFWRSNILSMPKLREKYDQLRLAALRQAEEPKDKPQPVRAYVSPPPRPLPGDAA